MKLNDNDIDTLARAETLNRRFDAGIFPRGAGQHRHFKRLERLGLIEFEGWGGDIDGQVDGDLPCYRLTDSGRAQLAARRP